MFPCAPNNRHSSPASSQVPDNYRFVFWLCHIHQDPTGPNLLTEPVSNVRAMQSSTWNCVCRKIWSDAASDHTHTCRIKVCFLSRACQHFETCTAFSKGYLSLNYVVKRGDGNCLNRKHCFQTPLLGMRLEQVGPWQQEHAAFPTSYQIRKQGVWTRSRSRSSSHPQVPFPGPTLKWQSQKFHNFPNSAIS